MNQTSNQKYEITYRDIVTLITDRRDKALTEVVRLRNAGISLSDIYIAHDHTRAQASKYLLGA